MKFFIPKASQNWIIGDMLVSPSDIHKTLKDYKVSGEFVSEVKVFMYVKHAKKAQVPKEELESIRNTQVAQRERLQGQGRQGQWAWFSGCGSVHGWEELESASWRRGRGRGDEVGGRGLKELDLICNSQRERL